MKDIARKVILFQKRNNPEENNYDYLLIPEWKAFIHTVKYDSTKENSQIEFSPHNLKSSVLDMRDIYELWNYGKDSYKITELEPNNKALDSIKNYNWLSTDFLED